MSDVTRDERLERDVERILSRFAAALEGVEIEGDFFVDRDRSVRDPEARDAAEGFKERILSNAPHTDGDRIIAERRSW